MSQTVPATSLHRGEADERCGPCIDGMHRNYQPDPDCPCRCHVATALDNQGRPVHDDQEPYAMARRLLRLERSVAS